MHNKLLLIFTEARVHPGELCFQRQGACFVPCYPIPDAYPQTAQHLTPPPPGDLGGAALHHSLAVAIFHALPHFQDLEELA